MRNILKTFDDTHQKTRWSELHLVAAMYWSSLRSMHTAVDRGSEVQSAVPNVLRKFPSQIMRPKAEFSQLIETF
jgi:hypothetical protein